MRIYGLSLAILAITSLPAMAAAGDEWILGIHHFDQGIGTFTANVGAGYSGPVSSGNSSYFGNSYQHSGGMGDISRIYWELSGNATNTGRAVPATTELYKIDYWGVAQQSGRNDFQVIESMFHGDHEGNDGYPAGYPFPDPNNPPPPSPAIDKDIPWVGAFSSNHQWVRAPRKPVGGQDQPIVLGAWNATGDGPHTPDSADFNAEEFGIYMWLTAGSRVYVKWDQSFTTNRTWSALRLTQVTPFPGAPVTGDYNSNGTVDAADYVVWRKSYGQRGDNLPADGRLDGVIDEDDYDVWRENFGRPPGSGSGDGLSSLETVPEPATIAMLSVVALVCLTASRQRNR